MMEGLLFMKLKSFLILLVTGLLLFLFGCEHGAIPAEMLAKTPWYQKQLKLIRENNADQIQAPLAKQGIAVGRIIQKFSDNTLQVNGNVPFGNSSIRFSDADSAAKISEGDWIVARVMRDPKGRPPLIQDYRKVSVNTDFIPEEFHPDLGCVVNRFVLYYANVKKGCRENGECIRTT